MRVIRDNPGRQVLQSAVVTIGNFDGLHLGHQGLLQKCQSLAKGDLPIAVVTFEPLPRFWFNPDSAPARLKSVRQKLEYLSHASVDLVWLMRFNRTLAVMEAKEFVRSTLVKTLAASEVVVGDDFHYGKGRQGNAESLRAAGEQYGFGLTTLPTIEVDGQRVSSSSVREALDAGDFARVNRLLGHPFRTQGRIIRGRQLGRKFGYPTANMRLAATPSPLKGIFAIRARWCERGAVMGKWHNGVANLGTRPAVGGEEFLIEAHLFDFAGDLYGRRMEVEYVEKLRNEAHFADIDDLVTQMREDERLARQSLLRHAGTWHGHD